MSAEEIAAQEPATIAEEVIADAIEAGIVSGETGEEPVIDVATVPLEEVIIEETEETPAAEEETPAAEEETPAAEEETPAEEEETPAEE